MPSDYIKNAIYNKMSKGGQGVSPKTPQPSAQPSLGSTNPQQQPAEVAAGITRPEVVPLMGSMPAPQQQQAPATPAGGNGEAGSFLQFANMPTAQPGYAMGGPPGGVETRGGPATGGLPREQPEDPMTGGMSAPPGMNIPGADGGTIYPDGGRPGEESPFGGGRDRGVPGPPPGTSSWNKAGGLAHIPGGLGQFFDDGPGEGKPGPSAGGEGYGDEYGDALDEWLNQDYDVSFDPIAEQMAAQRQAEQQRLAQQMAGMGMSQSGAHAGMASGIAQESMRDVAEARMNWEQEQIQNEMQRAALLFQDKWHELDLQQQRDIAILLHKLRLDQMYKEDRMAGKKPGMAEAAVDDTWDTIMKIFGQ